MDKTRKNKMMPETPLVSIITISLNSQKTIRDTIESVLGQTYKKIEYIIIDGGSTDGTLKIINEYRDKIKEVISEPDKGIYNAMNKGIDMSTGDIIGILNSDDSYYGNEVIETIVKKIETMKVDVCWGDLIYVEKNNLDKIKRYWKSSSYKEGIFQEGWTPPHPTFFVRRNVYKKYGIFNTNLSISSDYELMLRFLEKDKVSSCYIEKVLVKMRTGGQSNRGFSNLIKRNIECYQSWKINGLKATFLIIILRSLNKIPQYFIRDKNNLTKYIN